MSLLTGIVPLKTYNTISPNSDGHNDYLKIEVKESEFIRFRVYNEHSVLIYETKENGCLWDGVSTSGYYSVGTNFFRLYYVDENGVNVMKTGVIYVER